MRNIKYIVLHCTGTTPETTLDSIKHHWRHVLGWKNYGYHYIILKDGQVVNLTPEVQLANGVKGYNKNSIHVSYVGGMTPRGNYTDTRNLMQKSSLDIILRQLTKKYPNAELLGHRDFPKVQKACPCFDTKEVYKHLIKTPLYVNI